ncbi:MAG: PAS domain S-box protein [Gammaproteobacteria bacterium]|nr:PAS domain S-box protein [Gammaproteobacteria bacterium]
MRLPDTYTLPFPVFVAGSDGRIESTNAAFEALLPGRTGTTWLDAIPRLDSQAFGQTWAGAEPGQPPLTLRTSLSTATGETRHFDVVCQPLLASETDPTRLLGILLDITEQTRREAENRAILETAVDAIIMIDEAGRIETFNPAASALFGYAAEEIVGQPITRLMPEPHRSRHDEYMRRYMDTGEKRIIGIGRELEAEDRAGRRIPIYLAVSEILLQGRRRFTGIIRDLSAQRADREALAEQRERLAHVGRLSTMGEMTASIAHEINQPLTAISMYAQSGLKLIERGDPDLGKLAGALDKLNTQSLRAGAIIERIQRFARAQDSQYEFAVVNDLLKDLVKLAEGDARIHDVVITFDLAENLPAVYCDPIQIQQVALNLIRNAIDAMKEIGCRHGNALCITSRALSDTRLEVAVTDQGPGVPDDQINLLFKPFHTTKKDGMGMGLSICRSIIAEHGGELSFRNNADAGATFYFTLPVQGAAHD